MCRYINTGVLILPSTSPFSCDLSVCLEVTKISAAWEMWPLYREVNIGMLFRQEVYDRFLLDSVFIFDPILLGSIHHWILEHDVYFHFTHV
jgi:hypothetical protein